MGLRGNLNSIRGLKKSLRALPLTVAHDVTQRAAPEMTREAETAFAAGRTVYGRSRPLGVDGDRLSLQKTGAAKRVLRFRSSGTQLRSVIGPNYVRYLIGKYDILPNGPLPTGWSRRLGVIVSETKVKL